MHAMVDNDAAFLWETEALRTSPRREEATPLPAASDSPSHSAERRWVTLRDAHYETGIPVETLRKWARRKSVPSSMEQTDYGIRRMISLDDVIARADALNRPIAPVPLAHRDRQEANTVEHVPQPAEPQSDPPPVADSETEPASEAGPTTEPAVPDGTVLVPIAAWDKMLIQLGNLHEAGQQLAEAKERAAKAETEAKFLRERLREVRDAPSPTSPINPTPSPGGAEPEEVAPPEKMWRYVYRGWRRRRKT